VYDEFEHLMQESLEGQAMELGWVRDNKCDCQRRGLPADGPQEDVLVQLHSSVSHRRAHRDERRR
jgi:hypothetical protein